MVRKILKLIDLYQKGHEGRRPSVIVVSDEAFSELLDADKVEEYVTLGHCRQDITLGDSFQEITLAVVHHCVGSKVDVY